MTTACFLLYPLARAAQAQHWADVTMTIKKTRVFQITVIVCGMVLGQGLSFSDEDTHFPGVVIVQKLPSPSLYATEGKEVSRPNHSDDTPEMRKKRMEAARNLKMFIQIDHGAKQVLDQHHDITFKGMDVEKKHLFTGYDLNGQQLVSFYFSFGNRKLIRIYYVPGYANWRIS